MLEQLNWKQIISIWKQASRTQLTSLIIPNTVINMWEGAFRNKSIATLTLSNNLVNIPKYAFYANDITNLTIPSNITNIEALSFWLNYLTSVTIPASVTNIGWGAFNNQYWLWGWTVYWPVWYVKDVYDNSSTFDKSKLPTYVIQP